MLCSVVMPSYNQGGFIEKSICSVLDQSHKMTELIVMDGGSTDDTLVVLSSLVRKYGDRLRYISEKDSGPANAINKALDLANGEIIGWLNSDDVYFPEAISRAMDFFKANNEMVMLYGEGHHIDENDQFLERYPTLPHGQGLDRFQQGCYICQPTAFLRREVFDSVGKLDESLSAAFDFELWLRVFKAYPDRIAYIDEVVAGSRLHDDCITKSQRRIVAVEAMRVLSQHLGKSEPHWLQTYFNELCDFYPLGDSPNDLQKHMISTLKDVKKYLEYDDFVELNNSLFEDARWKLASLGLYVDVFPDGWVGREFEVRINDINGSKLNIYCECNSQMEGNVTLKLSTPRGEESMVLDISQGYFPIVLEIPDDYQSSEGLIRISSDKFFVPAQVEKGSSDTRELTFQVKKVIVH